MTVTIDEALLRRMARDAAIFSLTRPRAIVMWIILAAALVVSTLGVTSAGSGEGTRAFLPVASLGLMAFAVVMTVSKARRAVRVAMPPGTIVWARVGAEALHVGAGSRTSDISYSTFQSVRAGRHAVLFTVRGAAVITAIPRALLSDSDIAQVRDRVG
ncbi:hypothetical protein [Microbacterium sp. 3J1]|uniref:hypothetical protein n=1 Tax=Microbacterium sp. 3J1 TaxID=861269 RepID=UPI000A9D55A8|nr:hypothetical protein [Microbacterium sp. 3J1]